VYLSLIDTVCIVNRIALNAYVGQRWSDSSWKKNKKHGKKRRALYV